MHWQSWYKPGSHSRDISHVCVGSGAQTAVRVALGVSCLIINVSCCGGSWPNEGKLPHASICTKIAVAGRVGLTLSAYCGCRPCGKGSQHCGAQLGVWCLLPMALCPQHSPSSTLAASMLVKPHCLPYAILASRTSDCLAGNVEYSHQCGCRPASVVLKLLRLCRWCLITCIVTA